LERWAFADHISNVLIGPDLVSQIGVDAVPDGIQQGFIVDRFRQKVCCACFDRADSRGDVPVAGEKYNRDLRVIWRAPVAVRVRLAREIQIQYQTTWHVGSRGSQEFLP
jgi:hypothetical protein